METIPSPAHRGRTGKRCPPAGGRIGNRVKIPDGHAAVKEHVPMLKSEDLPLFIRSTDGYERWPNVERSQENISGDYFAYRLISRLRPVLFCVIGSYFVMFLLHKKALCALARRCRMSQAAALGARMCQGTFFIHRKNRNRNRKGK